MEPDPEEVFQEAEEVWVEAVAVAAWAATVPAPELADFVCAPTAGQKLPTRKEFPVLISAVLNVARK